MTQAATWCRLRHGLCYSLSYGAIVMCNLWASAVEATEPHVPQLDRLALQQLLPTLRQGGLVIFFRHAATAAEQQDRQPVDLEDCTSQRNLSAQGIAQASQIGSAFRTLKIPVEQVLSSPFCRCLDTARQAFAQATPAEGLYFAIGLDRAGRTAKGQWLRQQLQHAPEAGKNMILVSHTANLQEATGVWPKPEGASVLFRPRQEKNGEAGWEILGQVSPEVWAATAGLNQRRKANAP